VDDLRVEIQPKKERLIKPHCNPTIAVLEPLRIIPEFLIEQVPGKVFG
jgi:hypothetical protein